MRELERIHRITKLIEEIWELNPDFRFIQLVEMIKGRYSRDHENAGRVQYYYEENGRMFPYNIIDLFHLEDYELECYLYEMLDIMKSHKSEFDLFFDKMLDFFPNAKVGYYRSISEHGERLETVIIEDVFMPEINRIIIDNKDADLLERFFCYIEEVLNTASENLKNDVFVTILESLGNEKSILDTAGLYMGTVTKQLQLEADRALGRKE